MVVYNWCSRIFKTDNTMLIYNYNTARLCTYSRGNDTYCPSLDAIEQLNLLIRQAVCHTCQTSSNTDRMSAGMEI